VQSSNDHASRKEHAMSLGRLRSVLTALAVTVAAAMPALARDASPPAATPILDAAAFRPVVTNPYFPLASVHTRVLEGDFTDPDTGETVHERVEERLIPDPDVVVAGVRVAVVEVFEYADDEITEFTRDYYAQHEDGTVYYLGEDVDVYEDGEVVSHEGAWRAGEGNNQPGVFMPADPRKGMTFEQERAPGVAEDRSTVIATDVSIDVPAGSFSGCIETEDTNPLDGSTERKVYCPGVGIVREQSDDGALELVSFAGGPQATPEDGTAGHGG
jgi:hypothetical protein